MARRHRGELARGVGGEGADARELAVVERRRALVVLEAPAGAEARQVVDAEEPPRDRVGVVTCLLYTSDAADE